MAASNESIFNDPFSAVRAEQTVIRDHIVDLTEAADPGSTIRVSFYHLWSHTVARALAAAHTDPARGVNVQVVLDESSRSSSYADSSYTILADALGTDTGQSSFVTLCPAGRSCLGDQTHSGINHNKFALFSSVADGSRREVVVQTSSNLTPSSYDKLWNSATTVSGNHTLYNAYVSYFGRLRAKDAANWSYSSTSAGVEKVYFFPRSSGDTILGVLDNVECSWTDGSGTHKTGIRLAMFTLTRVGVANRLVELRRAGCTVDIVYSNTSADSWNALHASGGPVLRCYDHDDDGDSGTPSRVVHSKYMLIDGWYAGKRDKVVWTGSANYTYSGLRYNDETIMKINSDTVYAAYLANFTDVRGAAVPGTADDTAACKS
ncbi:phospholipase D-like domain-containing protein [Streptomyces pini]|uniref:phospholipase D n=1 Tax=Streptomyces pini TaxID=1520580 RepID=A0A1I3YX33_9ACTN|nr:phospholipase D-like domain-containing protein [Streptomyces pini]SFK35771.1 Phosphatidylserine/phosphatidylglycerophosphate/cardiolipin synthase [Streptomyces pini]